MLSPLTASPGADTSMSSLEDFRVRISPRPASESVLLAHAQVSGQSLPAFLAKYDPATHSLRTPQISLFEGFPECLQTLPRWGWMHAGAVWGLTKSERPISGSGFGYWPTPRNNTGPSMDKKHLSLDGAVKMWPTIKASDWKNNPYQRKGKYQWDTLSGAVKKFPTPRANKWGVPDSHGNTEMFATPTASPGRSGKASPETLERNARPLNEQLGGLLNPMFAEWLLGWPIMWTVLEPLAMALFQQWQSQHGAS
jgi:hypothetical protein